MGYSNTLTTALTTDPGAPRLTYYGTAGERLEVSGKVLRQWVAKISNMLAEECDIIEGDTVTVATPAHWLGVACCGAAWALGASATDAGPADATITDTGQSVDADPGTVVALTTTPLARAMPTTDDPWWDVDLIAGSMTAADDPAYDAPDSADAPAAASSAGRYAVCRSGRLTDVDVRAWWSLLLSGGSLVLVADSSHDIDRICRQELAEPWPE